MCMKYQRYLCQAERVLTLSETNKKSMDDLARQVLINIGRMAAPAKDHMCVSEI